MPLKPAAFHILLALADRDRHGYAVMQAVREQSAGRVPLRTGSFYRHLARLIDARLVSEAPGKRPDDDPRRGAYLPAHPARPPDARDRAPPAGGAAGPHERSSHGGAEEPRVRPEV